MVGRSAAAAAQGRLPGSSTTRAGRSAALLAAVGSLLFRVCSKVQAARNGTIKYDATCLAHLAYTCSDQLLD